MKKKLAIVGLALATLMAVAGKVAANGVGTVFIADETGGTVTVLDGVNHLTVERTGVGEGPAPDEFPRATWLVIGTLALLPLVAGLAYHCRIRGPR